VKKPMGFEGGCACGYAYEKIADDLCFVRLATEVWPQASLDRHSALS